MDEPLIYTTRGNMPISSLQLHTQWEDTPDYVKLIEVYTYNGEVVRASTHVLARQGAVLGAQTSS